MLGTNSCISRETSAHVHAGKCPNLCNVVVYDDFLGT